MKQFLIVIFVVASLFGPYCKGQEHLKSNWESGVAIYSFSGVPFEKMLQKADSTGSKYIEGFSWLNMGEKFGNKTIGDLTLSEAEKARKILNRHHLIMPSVYIGKVKNSEEWAHYFKVVKALGAVQLTGEPPLSQLDIIDSIADKYHMKFAIHQHKRGSSIYWHPYIVLAAISGHKNIGACADVGHWIKSGLNVLECVRILKGHILEMHIKDIDENMKDVDLGDGKVDFPAVINELKHQGFHGYMYIEYERRFVDNVPDIKNERLWINNLLKE